MTDFERTKRILCNSSADWSMDISDRVKILTILDNANKKGIELDFYSDGKFMGLYIIDD